MSSANKTENYNLSQFVDSDKPSWRGDYSGDMSKIDAGILEAKTAAVSAQNTANTAQTTASELSDAVDTAQSTADAAQSAANSAQQTADAALPKTTAEAQYLKQSVAAGTYETSVKHDADVSALRNDLLSKSQAASTYETQSSAQTAHTSLTNQVNAKANASDVYTKEQADDGRYIKFTDSPDLTGLVSPSSWCTILETRFKQVIGSSHKNGIIPIALDNPPAGTDYIALFPTNHADGKDFAKNFEYVPFTIAEDFKSAQLRTLRRSTGDWANDSQPIRLEVLVVYFKIN